MTELALSQPSRGSFSWHWLDFVSVDFRGGCAIPAFEHLYIGNIAKTLRTCFMTRHVCDGGEVGCRSRRRVRSNMSILRGLPTKRCAQIAPSPPGLRPGRSSAALPSSTISTYCLRRAPCIRSVLATTHHASIYEIGSTSTISQRSLSASTCPFQIAFAINPPVKADLLYPTAR